MPKFSKETASDVREMGPVTDRREEMNGYTVEFVSFAADADLDGPLQALPGGACQCPHWGYVIAGRMRFVFGDREEVYEAGERSIRRPDTGRTSTRARRSCSSARPRSSRFSNARRRVDGSAGSRLLGMPKAPAGRTPRRQVPLSSSRCRRSSLRNTRRASHASFHRWTIDTLY